MKTLKTLFLITFIFSTSFCVIAQESLFKDYLKTKSKVNLSREQSQYLDLKMAYYDAKKSKEESPCSDVRRNAYKSYITDYETLFFIEQNDINFFSECELWQALRINSNRTQEEKMKGLEILQKLGRNGNTKVQYYLALEYGYLRSFKNMKLDQDMNQYFKYMKMAAEKNYPDATYRVSIGYDYKEDYKNAVIWLEKAIANETEASKIGQYRWELASYYEKGKGVDKDLKKAYNLYQMGADISASASNYYWYSFKFGLMLYENKGPFSQNREIGLKYIKSAAKSNTVYQAVDYCKENGIYY